MTGVIATERMSVRAKPAAKRFSLLEYRRVFAVITLCVAVAGTLGYDAYSGRFGLIGEQPEIIINRENRIIRVPPGGNVQAAIERAQSGDIVELQAGAVYHGQISLPNKPITDFVTIQSSAVRDLPAGKRVSPRQKASMATITAGMLTRPAILAEKGAHHYRFVGIEFGPTTKGYFNIIQIGTGNENSVDEIPHHIEFDRVYVRGHETLGQRRGIAANGKHIKISNSYFADLKREGEESQAIAVWAADGPIEITNNYIEAAAEGVLFGGAESKLGIIPGNAVIRDNWFNKPLNWRSKKWVVKNHLEIKSGQNIKIENNLMTNNWEMGQEGTAVLFRTGVDSGKDAIVSDVEFSNNIVRGTGSAINIFGGEGKGGHRLTIRNNVFEDVSAAKWGGRGFFIKSTTWQGLVIENNTVINDGHITIAYGGPVNGLVFRGNIVSHNEYGFFGDGTGVGKVAITRFYPSSVITDNLLIGGEAAEYGSVNQYPRSTGEIGFLDAAAGDYRIRVDSAFYNKGGKSVGADLDPKTVGGQ